MSGSRGNQILLFRNLDIFDIDLSNLEACFFDVKSNSQTKRTLDSDPGHRIDQGITIFIKIECKDLEQIKVYYLKKTLNQFRQVGGSPTFVFFGPGANQLLRHPILLYEKTLYESFGSGTSILFLGKRFSPKLNVRISRKSNFTIKKF